MGTISYLAWASGVKPDKFGNKELDQMHGLNQYDIEARYYDPPTGRFTTIDPMAEKYYSISPYVYCANNPLRFIDPTGMVIDSLSQKEWNNKKNQILDKMADLNKGRIKSLLSTLNDMRSMENSETVYSLNKVDGSAGYLKYDPSTGNMVIDYNGTANFVHEVTHGGQFERGEVGYLTSGGAIAIDIWDEVAAYKAQHAYNPTSTGAKNVDHITPKWVRGLRDENGLRLYAAGGSSNIGRVSLNKKSGLHDYLWAYPNQRNQIIQMFGGRGAYGLTLNGFNNLIFK